MLVTKRKAAVVLALAAVLAVASALSLYPGGSPSQATFAFAPGAVPLQHPR
jgi:hypothetical protein